MSIKGKLNRMKKHLSIGEGKSPPQNIEVHHNHEIPFHHKWEQLDCKPNFLDDEYSFIREVKYPIDHQHGRYTFRKLHEICEQWREKIISHPLSSRDVSIRDLMFFDTETTGLSSGAGNYIFMIGYATVLEDEVVVKQHFIPSPASEVAMYQAFLSDFKTDTKLVSYNGKSFDWPQVKTRHTFVRERVPALPEFGHFDLLHAARRLWKHHLPSCKLSVVEKEILDFKRVDDTPGYLAPMLYFDFLQERDPDYIEGIMKHNEWDVLSLIGLYTHVSSCILNKDAMQLTTRECYEIGRWFEQLGELDLAMYHFQQALVVDEELYGEVCLALGLVYKKHKQYDLAKEILERGFKKKFGFPFNGLIELAKLYEHQFNDPEMALFYSRHAYNYLKGNKRFLEKLQEVTHRITRLETKVDRDG